MKAFLEPPVFLFFFYLVKYTYRIAQLENAHNKSDGRKAVTSNCAFCNSKKSRFMKEKEASVLRSLGTKTRLSRFPLVGPLFF